jgi:hypothetical protein
MVMSIEVSERTVIDSFIRSRAIISWANEEMVLILRFIYELPFLTDDSVI